MATREKTWVMLRGLARETAHWGDFVELMKKAFPNDQIIALDLPGAGEFANVNCPLTIQGIVKFLEGQLGKKNPQYPIHFVAISLGGMVALEWMKKDPMNIHGGIIINTSASNLSPFYQRLRWESYVAFVTKTVFLSGADREKAILEVISNRADLHDDLSKEWAEVAEQRPVRLKNTLRQITAAFRYKLKEKVQPPCLLLVGLGDHLVSPNCSEAIHQKLGYPIERHPWAGHDIPIDDGPWVIKKIQEWSNSL